MKGERDETQRATAQLGAGTDRDGGADSSGRAVGDIPAGPHSGEPEAASAVHFNGIYTTGIFSDGDPVPPLKPYDPVREALTDDCEACDDDTYAKAFHDPVTACDVDPDGCTEACCQAPHLCGGPHPECYA